MSRKSDQLAVAAFVDSVTNYVEGQLKTAAGVARVIAGDMAGLGDVAAGGQEVLDVYNQVYMDTLDGPLTFGGYINALAQQGMLLASAADAVSWYRATHKASGGGKRTTTSRRSSEFAYIVGRGLAFPTIRKSNGLTRDALLRWEKDLRDQGMDGLEKVIGQLVRGFDMQEAQLGQAAGAATAEDDRLSRETTGAKDFFRDYVRSRKGTKESEPIREPREFSPVTGVVALVLGWLLLRK